MAASAKRTTVIGLVGGIASGKSTVASLLAEMGAEVIDADALVHSILEQPLIVRRLTQEFGEDILADGEKPRIDRRLLGELVFGEDQESADNRAKLESIVHPVTHAEAIRKLRALKESDEPPKAIVVDAPLLLEADWAPMCDLIIFVEAPAALRLERALTRGWSEAHFYKREASQLSIQDKLAAATHKVQAVDLPRLKDELRILWSKL
jgi:dephospho-CoA kinase